MAGQEVIPVFLTVGWVRARYGRRKSVAIDRYKQFVSEGKGQPSPCQFLKNQVFLGGEQFVEHKSKT
jgi:putative transposase